MFICLLTTGCEKGEKSISVQLGWLLPEAPDWAPGRSSCERRLVPLSPPHYDKKLSFPLSWLLAAPGCGAGNLQCLLCLVPWRAAQAARRPAPPGSVPAWHDRCLCPSCSPVPGSTKDCLRGCLGPGKPISLAVASGPLLEAPLPFLWTTGSTKRQCTIISAKTLSGITREGYFMFYWEL